MHAGKGEGKCLTYAGLAKKITLTDCTDGDPRQKWTFGLGARGEPKPAFPRARVVKIG